MKDKGPRFPKPGQLIESLTRIQKRETEKTRNDEPLKASIASSYTGGDPTILLPGESSASSDTKKSIVPFGYCFPHASDEIVVLPLGNDMAMLGRVLSVQAGAPDTGAYYLLPNKVQPETVSTFVSSSGTTVHALKVLIDAPLTVTTVAIEVTTATAAALAAIGLYGSAGTTLVLNSGAIDCSSIGVKTASVSVYLPPAWYWYAWTISDTTTALRAAPTVGANITNLLNQTTVLKGDAANAATAAVLPASLGAVSSTAFASLPFAKLQG